MPYLSRSKTSERQQQKDTEQFSSESLHRPIPTDSTHGILGLQHTAGNQAVTRLLQQSQHSPDRVDCVPSIVHNMLNSPGQPLDTATRALMEARFRHDFSQVKVHTGTQAAASASQVNALAYTVGSDVVFGEGQYTPETHEGQRLLTHELTHVVQQRQTRGLRGILQRQAKPGHSAATPSQGSFSLELYVDGYEHANYQIDYRSVQHNLSKWIILTYFDGTVIDVNIDDIGDEISPPEELIKQYDTHIGVGGRFFPKRMNRSTTPRLWAAKQEVLKIMDDYNLKSEVNVFPVLWLILTSAVPAGAGTSAKATRRPSPRVPTQEEETPPPEIKSTQKTSSESASTPKQYKRVPETGSKGSQRASVKAAKSQEVETEEPATGAKPWRGNVKILDGNNDEGWIHIDGRHVTGNHPDGPGDLFAPGTSRTQLEKAANEIVQGGYRVTKNPLRRLQTFQKNITVNGKTEMVRVVVDTHEAKVITIFPPRSE